MISIGLSLDRTRLMETMDLLEQVEQNMMHRSRPKECRRAQHKSIKVPLDGEEEDEEEEEEEEEEGEEEEEIRNVKQNVATTWKIRNAIETLKRRHRAPSN